MSKFSIAVSENNLKELDFIAHMEDRSKNWLINQAIEMYLENWFITNVEKVEPKKEMLFLNV
ncbi:MAG TPA: ribbon-helix-helix protein, CopG family [Candidatus Paceibacterota bacterium]